METNLQPKTFELIYAIVKYGLGSKTLRIAKRNGVLGGTIFLGKGTVKNRLVKFLDLGEMRKEIVLMVTDKSKVKNVLNDLEREFQLKKPNHGIAFAIPISSYLGAKNYAINENKEIGGSKDTMYNAIFVVVEKGNAELVIDAATKAGSRGGTIINARGSGIHEVSKLFSMDIEPEKEIILILSEHLKTDLIVKSIREDLKIDEPGNGIIFVQDATQTHGVY